MNNKDLKERKRRKEANKERKERMQLLRDRGLSYRQIGKVWAITGQRVHQILSGYEKCLQNIGEWEWYGTVRLIIFERDKHKCIKCGSTDIQIHHIDLNDNHNKEDNLITLCSSCHTKLHAFTRKNNLK